MKGLLTITDTLFDVQEVNLSGSLNAEIVNGKMNVGKGEKGESVYEGWLKLEGNEGKTYDEFLIYLGQQIDADITHGHDNMEVLKGLGEEDEHLTYKGKVIKGDTDYIRTQPTSIAVGGVKSGSTFNGTIQDVLDKLFYPPVAATLNFSIHPSGNFENGYTISTMNFNTAVTRGTSTLDKIEYFVAEKNVGTQMCDNNTLSYNFTAETSITNNTNLSCKLHFTLDGEKKSVSATKSISFLNKAYWGSKPIGAYDSLFINTLSNNTLTNTKNRTITINCQTNEYIYYAIPTSFGSPTFTVGGFVGGFELVDTIDFTNQQGYTTSYAIWKSIQNSLGNTTIVIS